MTGLRVRQEGFQLLQNMDNFRLPITEFIEFYSHSKSERSLFYVTMTITTRASQSKSEINIQLCSFCRGGG